MKKNIFLLSFFLIFVLMTTVQARETVYSLRDQFKIDLVRIDPSPLSPGSTSDLVLEVKNLKDQSIENTRFELTSEFPLQISTTILNFPVLQKGETKELLFKITAHPDAQDGSYKTTLHYYINDIAMTATVPINITVRRSKALLTTFVETFPSRVEPGKEISLKLKLRNTADTSLKDLTFRLELLNVSLPFIPVGATSERTIKVFGINEVQEVEFTLLVSPTAELTIYKLPLSIKFSDALGNQFTTQDIVGIIVDSAPEYSLTLDRSEVFNKGDKGKVSLAVSNIGNSEMKFISLTLLSSENYQILSKEKNYIGNLESNDFETADFDIYINKNLDSLPLKVLLEYKDVYNKYYRKEQEIQLPLYTKSDAVKFGLKTNNNALWMFFVVVVLLVFAIIIKKKYFPKKKN